MKFIHVSVCAAALLLAACGQQEATTAEAPPAPQSLMEQVQAMAPEQQLVKAYQDLAAYQAAHTDAQPACRNIRATESRGVIPANVAPDSVYTGHTGALAISVQCGQLVSRARMDPAEHWLVIYAPGATEASVVNCADGVNDRCPRELPLAAVPAATTTTP